MAPAHFLQRAVPSRRTHVEKEKRLAMSRDQTAIFIILGATMAMFLWGR